MSNNQNEIGIMSKRSMQQLGMYPSETGKFMHVGSSIQGYGHPGYGQPQQPPYPISRDDAYSESQRRMEERYDFADPAVSSAVREVASRMNDVSLTQQQHMHGLPRDFGHRPSPEDIERAQSGSDPRDYVGMPLGDLPYPDPGGPRSALSGHMKMHPGFPGMYAPMHHSMPYVPAQPPSLPWTGMQAMGYGPMPGRFDFPPSTTAAKHNKYCHFCQHVKVRASGMLACCNKDCTRRFCEHCLSKSIGDDVNPQTSPAWINGQWHCPVCRKLCCCAIGECDKNHRHCKAYRYRVRRAEQQASKRASNSTEQEPSRESPPHDDKEGKEDQSKPAPAVPVKTEAPSRPAPEREIKPQLDPQVQAIKQEEAQQGTPRSFKSPLQSPSMMYRQMRAMPQLGADNQNFADPNDVQRMADNWLNLFQDEDVEDDSFLFAPGQDPRQQRPPASGEEWPAGGGVLKEESRGSIGMASNDSSESLQKLLTQQSAQSGAEALRRSSSNDLLAGPSGLPYNNSSDSLPSLGSQTWNPNQVLSGSGALPRNMSTDSLGAMMPRNFSSNSLGAVFEQCEGWQGDQDTSQQDSAQGGQGADFDFLGTRPGGPANSPQSPPRRPSPRIAPGMYPEADGSYQRGFGRPPVAFSAVAGYDQGPSAGATETRKRMNRTSSHNNLVRESLRGQQGMPRPPSTEKLSRMCRADMGGFHDNAQQVVGMAMAPTKEDAE